MSQLVDDLENYNKGKRDASDMVICMERLEAMSILSNK
jgi:hypothetical protein